jgi:hypothetical protein
MQNLEDFQPHPQITSKITSVSNLIISKGPPYFAWHEAPQAHAQAAQAEQTQEPVVTRVQHAYSHKPLVRQGQMA